MPFVLITDAQNRFLIAASKNQFLDPQFRQMADDPSLFGSVNSVLREDQTYKEMVKKLEAIKIVDC